jgi:ribosome maturation factor RimP
MKDEGTKSPLFYLVMDIVAEIKKWSETFLDAGLFVVEVEWKTGSRKVVVYLDGDLSVTIEQCRQLSRHLSEKLDELDYGDEAYQLEVSSPGADKPLKVNRQYGKHVGRELMVKLTSNTELLGKLMEVNEDHVVLMLKDKKKGYPKEITTKEIPFNDIAESVVQISFK